jgi:hypothetical protein
VLKIQTTQLFGGYNVLPDCILKGEDGIGSDSLV